ncbi:MAG TPA: glycosyltransferase family 39 protein, partial [Anaerolineae bacterium]
MNLITQLEKKRVVADRRLLAIWLAPAIILLGTILRFLTIGVKSYWLDEVMMLKAAGGSLGTLFSQIGNGRPPVFVVLAYFWMQLFGTSEAATRSLSAIFGSLALIFMYLVGKELLGRRVGLIATFIMAISEFQIDQSQNFRYYAAFIFFALISFLAFWRALHTGKLSYWVVYGISTIATFYSHTHGVFLIAAQGLFFVLMYRRYRPVWLVWLVSQVLIFLGILPGLLLAFTGASNGTSNVFQWIRDPQLYAPLLTLVKFVLPGRHAPALITIAGALAFGLIGALLYILYRSKDVWAQSVRELPAALRNLNSKSSELVLLACWLVLPLALPLALSKVFGPMYLDRYVIGAAPALYLLIALAVVTLRRVAPVVVPLGMLVILITPGLVEYYTTPTNEQWREAAGYIQQNLQPQDRFILAPGENGAIEASLKWYYQNNLPGCSIEAATREPSEIAQALPQCLDGANRFWLV